MRFLKGRNVELSGEETITILVAGDKAALRLMADNKPVISPHLHPSFRFYARAILKKCKEKKADVDALCRCVATRDKIGSV